MKTKLSILLAILISLGLLSAPQTTQAGRNSFYPFPPVASDSDNISNSWFSELEAQCSSITISVDAPTSTFDYEVSGVDRVTWSLLGVYDMNDTLIPSDTGEIYTFRLADAGTTQSMTFNYDAPIAAGTRIYATLQRTAFFDPMDMTGSTTTFDAGDFGHDDLYARAYDTAVSSDFQYTCAPLSISSQPTLSVTSADVSIQEGNSGTTAVPVTVTLDAPSAETVTARLRIDGQWNGTGTSNAMSFSTIEGTDFTVPGGVLVSSYRLNYPFGCSTGGAYCGLTPSQELQPPYMIDVVFAPGETSKSVDMFINGEDTLEENERVLVCLWETMNAQRDSACNNSFPDMRSADMTINILDDDQANVTLGDIIWDECAVPGMNTTLQFPITLDRTMSGTLALYYSTLGGELTVGTEYEEVEIQFEDYGIFGFAPGTMVTVPAGNLTGSLPVNFFGDNASEPTETLEVAMALSLTESDVTTIDGSRTEPWGLYSNGPGNIQKGSAVVTIPANGPVTNLAASAMLAEGDSGQTAAILAITMNAPAQEEDAPAGTYRDVIFDYEVFIDSGDTASAADVVLGTGQVTIPAGQLTANIEVPVNGDTDFEGDETFSVRITGQNGACMQNTVAQVTITNDDDPIPSTGVVTFDAANGSYDENAGTVDVPLTLVVTGETTLSSPITLDLGKSGVAVDEVTIPATAAFTNAEGFPAGTYSGTIPVTIIDNADDEVSRDVTLTLSNPPTAISLGGPASFVLTINDDETFNPAPNSLTVDGALDVAPLTLNFGWVHQVASGVMDVPGADWYNLVINDGTNDVISEWFDAAVVCDGAVCDVELIDGYPYILADGTYTWTITGWLDGDFSPESDAAEFTVNIGAAVAPVVSEVILEAGQPVVGFSASSSAEWYLVEILDSADEVVYGAWFQESEICGEGCNVNTMTVFPDGDYDARISVYGPANFFGDGAVTVGTSFAFNVAVSGLTTDPVAAITVTQAQPGEPVVSWDAVSGVSWYHIQVINDAMNPIYDQWFAAADVCGMTPCVRDLGLYLMGGNYTVAMQTYGPLGWNNGDADFFTEQAFSVTTTEAATPASLAVLNENTGQPTLTWAGDANASWYQVWVGTSETYQQRYYQWNPVSELGCAGGGTCTLALDEVYLANGTFSWFVQGYGPAGLTAWTDEATFTVAAAMPTAPMLTSPDGTTTETLPIFTWDSITDATWHNLTVVDGNNVQVYSEWMSSESLSCYNAGTCTMVLDAELVVGAYTWTVQAYSPAGIGPASSLSFEVVVAAP